MYMVCGRDLHACCPISHNEPSMPLYVPCAVLFFPFFFPLLCWSFQKRRLDACMRLWLPSFRNIYLYMKNGLCPQDANAGNWIHQFSFYELLYTV